MTQINAKIDDRILKEFRDVIFTRTGLKKGDFKNTLEDAIIEYVKKHNKSYNAKSYAKRVKVENTQKN